MMSKWMTAGLLMLGGAIAAAADAPVGAPGGPGGPGAGGMGGGMMMDPAARFKMLDKNGDGKVTLEEYQAGAMRGPGGGQGGSPQGGPQAGGPPPGGPPGGGMMRMSPEERFKMMDANHDGVLTQQEFTDAMQRMREMMQQRMGGAGGPPANPPANPPKSN